MYLMERMFWKIIDIAFFVLFVVFFIFAWNGWDATD